MNQRRFIELLDPILRLIPTVPRPTTPLPLVFVILNNEFEVVVAIEVVEHLEKNDAYKFTISKPGLGISDFFNMTKGKIKLRKFEIVEPTLHDIFIKLIQEQAQKIKK